MVRKNNRSYSFVCFYPKFRAAVLPRPVRLCARVFVSVLFFVL